MRVLANISYRFYAPVCGPLHGDIQDLGVDDPVIIQPVFDEHVNVRLHMARRRNSRSMTPS